SMRGKKKVWKLNGEADNELIPGRGVYISRIALDGGPVMDAVTNVGIRPTFDESSLTIETFVLHDTVPEGVVGARLEFLHRLRDEKRFDTPDDLRAQIGVDVRRAQRFFFSVFGSSARRG